jgi:hypothetical protein
MPAPVATRSSELKTGAKARKFMAAGARIQMCEGGDAARDLVQSPAAETMTEAHVCVCHVGVRKREFDFAVRHGGRDDRDAADAQPRQDDKERGDRQHPDGRAIVECRVRWVDDGVDARIDPDDEDGRPAAKAMSALEGVVELFAETRDSGDADDEDEGEEGVCGGEVRPMPAADGAFCDSTSALECAEDDEEHVPT